MVSHLPKGPGPVHLVQEGDSVLLPFLLLQIREVSSHGNHGIPWLCVCWVELPTSLVGSERLLAVQNHRVGSVSPAAWSMRPCWNP
ncbi:hypothetical protein E2C01_098849 [Portunus trituberculatus]|uniref:Uncharacterized protein n=1 Tax=Portunus trituberculatus TaxID=210409 RepID=A0A5B7K9A0_PORTR|nr:hypothetical protein [Portunus trituberculatus]